MTTYKDIAVETRGHIAIIEIRKPPLNFFDIMLIQQIANALDEIDANPEIRATVLCAQGKAFCAGADFSDPNRKETEAAAKSGDPADNLGEVLTDRCTNAVRTFPAAPECGKEPPLRRTEKKCAEF